MQSLPYGLHALSAYRQFVVYKLVPSSTRIGKTDKLPVDWRTGALPASGAGGALIYTDAHTAIEHAAQYGEGYGVGFFFTERDPFMFLDIDNCLQPDGQWSELATSLIRALPNAYLEVSQSGRGLHIIATAALPLHSCKNTAYGLELYDRDRFVALTGTHASGDAATNVTYCGQWLVDSYFPPAVVSTVAWTDEPCEEWNGNTDDDELIRRALRSGSAGSVFGKRARFADLWEADVSVLREAFPDENREYDASSADAALAQHLAFWTGKDCERIVRLMHKSKLVRDKWERDDYINRTVLGACSRQVEVLHDEPPAVAGAELVPADAAVTEIPYGTSFLSGEQQAALFRNCVYVTDMHRVLVDGALLKPEQFRVKFGGYTFMTDISNGRLVRNAWEAFTESQVYQANRVDTSCFRPDLAPMSIIKTGGGLSVNIYREIKTPRIAGDVTPFLTHLGKLLPDVNDQRILLSYMAAVIQHKGVKFQWAPLLQGVEGNGKTLFTYCLAAAIGDDYTHYPKASQIAKQFNGWMHGKILIGVEDIYVPDSQREVLEELKPMITNTRIEVERKGVDQKTMEVCCNFILNSNHKDGIRKTRNDRRFAPFYTAQQEAGDLKRDAMTEGYFQRLYCWLRDDGFAYVHDFLATYKIPDDLNPALGHIAPITSSTEEAVSQSLGRIEQEILEAIDRGDAGFKGGWVSSIMLDKLLHDIGYSRSIAPNKRREIMSTIGYVQHPKLHDGRVNNNVLPDNGKPRLYIRKVDAVLASISEPADVARRYAMDQTL